MKQKVRKLLFEIEQMKRNKVQAFLLEIGLTPGQCQARILSALADRQHVSQKELADTCMLDVTTMSRTLDRLEKQGLILREKDPGCRRAYQISLTDEGRKKAGQVNRGFSVLEAMLCSGFKEEEIERLVRDLERIRKNLTDS